MGLDFLAAFVTSGRIIDFAVAVLVVETLALIVLARRTGRGPSAPALLWNAGAGLFLLLAIRSGLVGALWWVTAGTLGLALVAHIGDVVTRWREASR